MSDSLYLQQSTRLNLAVQRLRPLPEQARVPFADAFAQEVNILTRTYHQTKHVQPGLKPSSLLLAASNLMAEAYAENGSDPRWVIAHGISDLPIPTAEENPQWQGDLGPNPWWEQVASPSFNTPVVPSSMTSTPAATIPTPSSSADEHSSAHKRKRNSEDRSSPDGDRPRKSKGKTLIITAEMLDAGVNDPPCERCRDTRRNCTRGPHAACLTCVAGKTACSLVPPKASTSKGPGSKDETPRRRVRAGQSKAGNASADTTTSFPDMPAPPPPTLPVPMNNNGPPPPPTPSGTSGIPPYAVPPSPSATWNTNGFPMDPNAYVTRGELMMWQSQMKSWVESRLSTLTSQSPSTPTMHGMAMGVNGAPSGGNGAPPGQGMPMRPPGGGQA